MMYFDTIRLSGEQGKITFSSRRTADGIATHKARGKSFSLQVKEIRAGEFTVYEIILDARQRLVLSTASRQGVSLTIPLKSSLHYEVKGLEEAKLAHQHYNFFFSPHASALYKFKKGRYTIFTIHFDADYLWRWRGVHQKFADFMECIRYRRPAMLRHHACQATGEIMFIANDIFLGDKPLPDMYRYARVLELLRAAILQGVLPLTRLRRTDLIHERDQFKLRQVADYVKQHLVRPAGIEELAGQFNLNAFKLKSGFKALYGVTIFEYLTQARMLKARAMLRDENNPQVTIRQVGALVGFKNLSNFSNAYKRYYGHTPTTSRMYDDPSARQLVMSNRAIGSG